ncbi:MAG TPA: DUF5916 domain-containing protein [Pyrinomonadaceae bacterium]|nr:DUF5916 domain-containing protein [Pyrinomonadaceae bacterium]
MIERAVHRSLRSGASSSFLRRTLAVVLAALTFVSLLPTVSRAQQVASLADRSKVKAASVATPANSTAAEARPRRIAALRSRETSAGARVTVMSDAELTNYTTYMSDGRFVVLIPQAEAGEATASLARSLRGRGFEDARVERRGADVLLSFKLEAGAKAEVRPSFNRLEVSFAQEPQPKTNSAGGATTPAAPLPTASPVASPGTATPSDAPIIAPATTTSDSSTTSATVDRAKVAAGKGRAITLPPEKAAPVVAPRFDAPPVIDGKLDDAVWKSARVLKDFYQTQPGDNIAPSHPTEVLIGYDSKFLYIAFHAFDEPSKVRANVAKRDGIFDDDFVGMHLDTFNDQRRSFELLFNPLGIQADAIYTENSGEDFSFDLVMDSKGAITSDGYVVEVAIPFKSLRYEAGKGKFWGVHFFRRIKRLNNESHSWMPLSRDISGNLNQAGKLTGLEGISTERTLEIIPSLTVSETGRRVRTFLPSSFPNTPGPLPPLGPGRMLNSPVELDFGITSKFGLTPTITLDFAYNPDFAQVEADQTVVTANQRFPIFFEEKRPFFLEGKEIFDTSSNVVHTRAIVDPDYAVKLTGKRGRNTFGLILASDNGPGNFNDEDRENVALEAMHLRRPRGVDEAEDVYNARLNRAQFVESNFARFVDKNAFIGVLRLKRDVGKESSVGLFATTYNFTEHHNQLFGIDARFKLDPKTFTTFEIVGTNSKNYFRDLATDVTSYRNRNGFAYNYLLDYTGRYFGYALSANGRTRDYSADVGFTRQTNTNNVGFGFRLSTEPNPKAILTSFRFQNFTNFNYDWQGRSQSWIDGTNYSFSFAHQTFVQIGTNFGYERLVEEEFGSRRAPARFDAAGQQIASLRRGAFAGDDSERQTRQKTIFVYAERQFNKQFYASFFTGTRRGIFDFDFGAGPDFPRVSPYALAVREARAQGFCNPKKDENGKELPLPPICFDALDPGSANGFDIEASVTLQPTSALRTSVSYVKARLTRRDNGLVAFDDNIFALRTTYQFTRFLFARARIDYGTLSTNARGQFLFGWTPNPGTSFYVGYNDDLQRNGYNPFNSQLEPGLRRNGRTFFIKASYLFRRSF